MTDANRAAFSDRLQAISGELREIDMALKAGTTPDARLLQEFRQILDNARMTAWTVSELLNAVETQRDPAKVLSFVAAERLRRSNQMLRDLTVDFDNQGLSWQTAGIQKLFETVNTLQLQLREMLKEHRGRLEKVAEAAR